MNKFYDFGKKVLLDEAKALVAASENFDKNFDIAVNLIRKCSGNCVVSGIGKSGLVGRKISSTLASLGTPSVFLHSGEALHGDLGLISKKDVALLISNSGNTTEVLGLIPSLKMKKIPIIALTANLDSVLAKESDAVLNSFVAREADEHNLAPTSSTTVMMAIGDALAVSLAKEKDFTPSDFAMYHPGGSLGNSLSKVSQWMTKDNIPKVNPKDSLRSCVIKMSSGRLGAVVLVEESQIKGIFTDGDLRRLFENRESFDTLLDEKIVNVANKNPKTLNQDDLASFAIGKMEANAITVMPVVNNKNNLVGIIHLHNLVQAGTGVVNEK